MRINHNIAALNTHRQLGTANANQSKSMEKLSSGMRINRAGDDAAGLAISEKMRAQVRGLDQASANSQDAISLIQTAEGALNETHDILQRMRELAVQSSNDTNTDKDREELQKEVNQLSTEITRISTDTEFNTKKLINGDATELTFQIGANESQNLKLAIGDMGSVALKVGKDLTAATAAGGEKVLQDADGGTVGTWQAAVNIGDVLVPFDEGLDPLDPADDTVEVLATADDAKVAGYFGADGKLVQAAAAALADDAKVSGGIDISSQTTANSAITVINDAIQTVSAERSKLGANQNRLEHTINNLNTSSENLTAAESRIRDVDMAKEMMNQTKESILAQASQAMLAQANQKPQAVLQLLQ